MVVGITGGSGSGKSTVCDILRQNGAYIIDADKTARQIVKKGSQALFEIAAEFSKAVLLEDGELNRKKLGEIVFADEKKLAILNRITHKYIIEKIKRELNVKEELKIIDAALLFETELHMLCDMTICVTADRETRIQRIMKRDNISRQNAENRINSQHNNEYYTEKSDYCIDNSKNVRKEDVLKIFKEIGCV